MNNMQLVEKIGSSKAVSNKEWVPRKRKTHKQDRKAMRENKRNFDSSETDRAKESFRKDSISR